MTYLLLKHAPSLVSAIANETSNMFAQAEKSLESLDQELVAKWRHYLALKAKVNQGDAFFLLSRRRNSVSF